jgi:polysaccharide biosynthesis protein PslH
MRTLLLTTALFDSPANGGERCTQRLLQALAALGHEVDVVGLGAGTPAGAQRSHSLGEREPAFSSLPRVAQLRALGSALLRHEASSMGRLRRRAHRSDLQARLAAMRPQRLIVDHLQALAWLPPGQAVDLLVMHNLESEVYVEQALHAPSRLRRWLLRHEAERLRAVERQRLPRCAALACLSEPDAAHLRERLGPALPIAVLPGHARLQGDLPPPPSGGRRRLGVIGTWSWGPNRLALQWLLDEVWPRLRERCELRIAGTGLSQLALPEGIQALGRLDRVESLYSQLDVVLVPALVGSGVQEKAIEAIASGRAVVATPHALRGLAPLLPDHVHAGADAEHFAALCLHAALPDPDQARAQAERWAQARERLYAERLAGLLRA